MPARRNRKKSRTKAPTSAGTDPTAGRDALLPTRPDVDLAVEPALLVEPALPAALGEPEVLVEQALPAVLNQPALPAVVPGELLPPVDVPAAVDAPVVADLPKVAGRPKAPTAGPPQGGGTRSAGGRGQPAGQSRRYAFRRS
ncbi:hypothetical protein [Micromonospora sp. U21]|uniref:hypothetical protein n=1 Tax=Micromonospora sp. U21 TaxID=2824899 RepID=UPI001B366F4F|nr:hypothetical protein [Micromonospora sp. U21]MBQ0903836.1 hypothetical protein [Micromonospora sp. U21]